MSIKKKNSGINKKGKRRYNRTLCTLQTEQIYQELDTYIPSMDGVKKFKWYGLEKIKTKGDPKWLSFVINDIHFEIEVYVYQRTSDKTPFRYFPDIDGWPHRERISITNYWFISVCYRDYSLEDIKEIVEISYHLHKDYSGTDTIEEMKEIARNHKLSCVGILYEEADCVKLKDLFMEKHQIANDRLGLSSYFFENKSQKVLRMIYNEDDLEEWEDFDY